MIEVESQLNSRPLTHTPVDPDSEEVLTPHTFMGKKVPQPILGESQDQSKFHSCKRVQAAANEIMKRWGKEYLTTFTRREGHLRKAETIKTDDIVLLMDRSQPKLQWVKGRVLRTFPGKDGCVRVAEISLPGGKTRRTGVVNLCKLV